MAIPLGLSEKGEAIWNFIQSAITRGLGANQTLESLKNQGLGYRRTTFLSDFRIALRAEEKEATMKFVRKDYRITDKHYTPSKHPLAGGFRQTVFQIEGTDTRTGEDVIRHVTVAHDYITIRDELEFDAVRKVQGTSPWLEIKKITPVVARKYPEDYLA